MTVTTTYRKDFLGRWLVNANPGTTDGPTDFLGRKCQASNKDFLGRLLTQNNPAQWQGSSHAYVAGDLVRRGTLSTFYSAVYEAQDAGQSGSEPSWSTTVGGTCVDNVGVNSITWKCVHV